MTEEIIDRNKVHRFTYDRCNPATDFNDVSILHCVPSKK